MWMTCFANVWTTRALDDKFNIQVAHPLNSKIFGSHFASQTTRNNREMVAETPSYLSRWLPCLSRASFISSIHSPVLLDTGSELSSTSCLSDMLGNAALLETPHDASCVFLKYCNTTHKVTQRSVTRPAHLTYRLVRVKMTSSRILLDRESV